MSRPVNYLLLVALILVSGSLLGQRQFNAAPAVVAAQTDVPSAVSQTIAAPGRVEGISEEVKVSAPVSGRLKAVRVQEGDVVARGDVIALLEDDPERARLATAEALLVQQKAILEQLRNGARAEERLEVAAAVQEAETVKFNAEHELQRRQALFASGLISREELQRAEQQANVSQARVSAAQARQSLITTGTRREEIARAEASVAEAQSQVEEARALLNQKIIRAPISGVVLRRHLQTGESVLDAQAMTATPIVTLADVSRLRVRVEVDENDIAKLQLHQSAWVTADAFGKERFAGRVIQIGQMLGRKKLHTDEPTERLDTKILETLIELEAGCPLKPGLRVEAFITIAQPQS